MIRIIDHLRNRSLSDSGKTFVADQFRSVTYGSFYAQVLEKAAGLQSRGVGREDRVLLVLEHGIDHLVSYFASIFIGAIPVHLNLAKPRHAIAQAAEITSHAIALSKVIRRTFPIFRWCCCPLMKLFRMEGSLYRIRVIPPT